MKTRTVIKHVRTPLSVACLLFALCVTVFAVPGAFLTVAFSVAFVPPIVLLIGALAFVAVLVLQFWRRNWLSGVTMLGGLAAVVLLAFVPNIATSPAKWISEVAQVVWYRGALLQRADELRLRGVVPALAAVEIDGFISTTVGIALDPTGEILLKPEMRSKSWIAAAQYSQLGTDELEAHHIIGYYYWWID